MKEQALWRKPNNKNKGQRAKLKDFWPRYTNDLFLLSAVVHGSRDDTALVTAAAMSLCPLLSTEGSLRLSAGARPSVGRLVSTVACCAAA